VGTRAIKYTVLHKQIVELSTHGYGRVWVRHDQCKDTLAHPDSQAQALLCALPVLVGSMFIAMAVALTHVHTQTHTRMHTQAYVCLPFAQAVVPQGTSIASRLLKSVRTCAYVCTHKHGLHTRMVYTSSLWSHTRFLCAQAVLVGGGYIAMEVASQLANNGVPSTIVCPEGNLLSRLFTPKVSRACAHPLCIGRCKHRKYQ